jgi:hypothetical protein
VFLVFRIRGFFFPNILLFFLAVNLDGDIIRESLSVKFILKFFMIYVSRLRFYEPFFPMWSSVYVLCWFSFSQPDVNITWITGHIHRSIVDKIDPTSEYVEMVKKIYIINYIGLHSFVKCDQKNLFNRKKYFWWTVTRTIVWKMSFSLRV